MISSLFLSDSLNKQRLQIFASVSMPLRLWHGDQSHSLRSCASSTDFLMRQVAKKEWFSHVNDILNMPANEAVLSDCHFTLPDHPISGGSNDEMLVNAEMADLLGQYALALGINRQRRCLWLIFGWPHRTYGVLDPDSAPQVCADFCSDRKVFEEFHNFEGKVASDRAIEARSVMHPVTCKQFAAGLEETLGQPTEKFVSVVRQHSAGVISTQLIEDLIGCCKNDTECKASSRYHRPQKSMGKCITSSVLDQRHSYMQVAMGSGTIAKGSKLGKDAWQGKESSYSMEFQKIVSTTPAAPYHSPAASNACVRDADLQLLRDARASRQGFRSVRMAWLGELFQLSHRILFRKKNLQGGWSSSSRATTSPIPRSWLCRSFRNASLVPPSSSTAPSL